jgi:hypothetical protein
MLASSICGAGLFSAPSAGLIAVALSIGIAVLAMAYAVGPISGGHFNPAVTCGLVAAGRFDGDKAFSYIVAQVTGGVAAAAVFYLILQGAPAYLGRRQGLPAFERRLDRNSHDRAVPRGDYGCNLVEGRTRVCAARDRTDAGDDTSRLHPGFEHFGQSGALDRDRGFRRCRGDEVALAVLGGPDRWWHHWRADRQGSFRPIGYSQSSSPALAPVRGMPAMPRPGAETVMPKLLGDPNVAGREAGSLSKD